MRWKQSDFSWQMVLDVMRQRLDGTGIDLLHPFSVGTYNQAVDDLQRLPDFGSSSSLGILVANSRALWPAFLEAASANEDLVLASDPIDQYVKDRVLDAVDALPYPWEIRWEYEEPPRRVAIQKLAEITSFARLSASHLSIHPQLGPWVSLRAVAVVDVDGPEEKLQSSKIDCQECEVRCGALLTAALATAAHFESATVAQNWRSWLNVREACSVGASHKFYEDQILYHYTKDRRVLTAALELINKRKIVDI